MSEDRFVPFTYDDFYDPPIPARASVPVKGTLRIGYATQGPEAWFGRRCTIEQAESWRAPTLPSPLEGEGDAAISRGG